MPTYEELIAQGAKPGPGGLTYEQLVQQGAKPGPKSKEEVEAVMRQRYPQAFANPNAPQSVGEVFSSDHPLDTALEFGKGLFWDTATGIGNALLHPIDAARAAAKSHEDELRKAVIAAHQGNYSGAGGHALASVIPVIGPIAANIGEEIGATNEVARNMGRATSLIVASSPENIIKPSAPYVKGAIKGVWQNATRPAEFPIRLKGVPVEIPNTPQIAADVAEGAGIGHFVGPVGSATGAAIGAAKNIAQGVYRGVQDVVAQKRAAAMEAAKPAPVSAEPSVLPPPAPMPEAQPMVNLPGPSGTFVDVPPAPAASGNIPAPQAPSIVELKRAEAMQRLNPQAPVAEAPRFDPRSLPPDPIKSQPWYGDAVAAMRARRVGAPEVAPVETVNPAVADESQVGMIRQMAQERTPNALADAFRNITPEQRAEVIKAFDRERIVAAQDAMREQMKAQGFDAETAELAAQTEARPDFTETVPARIAKARANKAEGLFKAAREMGINPDKMAKLSPAKWEELAAKAGVRKPTWTANGSETVREVIQMAREWEAKNGPIQAPPKPMKKPSVTPGGLDTPEKIAAAEQLRQALAMEEAPNPLGKLQSDLSKKFNVDVSLGPQGDAIELSKIVVPKDSRGTGVGTAAMDELIRYADENGKRIVLSPSTDFGASSVARLKQFYKRFGFVENTGRNKDFSTRESMYRDPKSK
jgi:predicted GNAT family acetyltransferase